MAEKQQSSDTQTQDILRLEPEAIKHHSTATGQVADLTFKENEDLDLGELFEASYGQRSHRDQAHIKNVKRSLILLPLCFLLLGAGLFAYQQNRGDVTKTEEMQLLENFESEQNQFADLVIDKVEETHQKIAAATLGFVAAKTVEERYHFSRKHPQLRKRMEEFYAKHTLHRSPLEDRDMLITEPSMVDGVSFYDVIVNWKGIGRVAIPVCETEEGYRVDWEAVEVWQPTEWQNFFNGKFSEPLSFRVKVSPDDFFFAPYNSNEYISVRLSGNGFTQSVYAYIKRGSEVGEKFSKQLNMWHQGDLRGFKMILELRYLKSISTSVLVEIVDVQASSWLRADDSSAS